MAVVAEELISDLIVRDGKLRSGLRGAQQVYGQGIDRMRGDTKRFEAEFTRSSSNISDGFRRMAGVLAAGVSLRATGQLIDGYTRLQNQLRVTGLEGEKLAEVQERLRTIASTYGTDLESLATVYAKVNIAAGELGASSEQILRVNEAVAAALKVSGSSAEQSAGALLQFSQAMSSGTVRAEELNSIMEGAFPLAQAAARGIDRFGGSVAKMRAAILEGEVSSREFFQGVLAGAPSLIDQAAKANLTLAQSFTVVKNELMLYVGGAAQANGVTSALAEGIRLLAVNLDTIIPALAVIAAMIGTRYVAGLAAAGVGLARNAIASAQATAATQAYNAALIQNAGLLNVQAVAAGRAATATIGVGAAARGAGAALLSAFGGPVGVALIALGAGVAAVYAEVNQFSKSASDLESELEQLTVQADAMEEATRKAGGAIEATDKASRDAAKGVDTLGASYSAAARKANELAKQTGLALIKMQQLKIGEIQADRQALDRQQANRGRLLAAVSGVTGADLTGGRGSQPEQDANVARMRALLDAQEEQARRIIRAATANPNFGTPDFNPDTSSNASVAAEDKKTKAKRAPKGRDAERDAERAAQELAQLTIEELRAKEESAVTADERATIQREILNIERKSREDEVASAVRRKEISAQEGAERLKILRSLYGTASTEEDINVQGRESLYQRQISLEQLRQTTDDRRRLEETSYQIERDALADAYDMADTLAERRDLALKLIDLDEREQRAKLDAIIAVEAVGSARRQEAEALLAALPARTGRQRDRALEDTQGALGRYANEGGDPREQAEQMIVRKIQSVNEGIADALANELGVKDQFVKDLFSMFLEETIFKPLAAALAEQQGAGGGLGGLFGAVGSVLGGLFGGGSSGGAKNISNFKARAGGGPVSAGQLYRINEGQQEFFRPATDGRVVPLSQAQAARPGGGAAGAPIIVQLTVGEGQLFEPRVQSISGDVSIRTVQAASPGIVKAAGVETARRMSRVRV